MRKLPPPKVRGVKNSKKQTTKHYKVDFQRPKYFFVYCSIAIMIPRWFVELKMVFL